MRNSIPDIDSSRVIVAFSRGVRHKDLQAEFATCTFSSMAELFKLIHTFACKDEARAWHRSKPERSGDSREEDEVEPAAVNALGFQQEEPQEMGPVETQSGPPPGCRVGPNKGC